MAEQTTNYIKEVDFKTWCPSCESYGKKETEEPCNECLTVGGRPHTTKPVKYWNKDWD